MDNVYTIKEISEITNLKEQFIRKCIMEAKGQFDKFIVNRGKNNTIYFDSNALVLFDKIKQKKENGQVIPDILSWLFQNMNEENGIQTKNNTQNNLTNQEVIKSFEAMHREVILAKDETIKTKDEHIKALESKILLITDGKDPQLVKAEYEKKQEEFMKLKYNFENSQKELDDRMNQIDLLKSEFESSKKIIDEQSNLVAQKQAKLLELEEINKEYLDKESKKEKLINEILSIEGKLFMGKKRKELLRQLQELS